MSLSKVKLSTIVKKQFQFKLASYSHLFTKLIALQLMGILFSVIAPMSIGTSFNGVTMNISLFSANFIIIFTLLWIFISSMYLTTRNYLEEDFAFVTTRNSHHLSNIAFLLTASVISGLTAYVASFVMKVVIMFFFNDINFPLTTGIPHTFTELSSGIIGLLLYILLFSGLGYLIGSIIQLHRSMLVIIPAFALGYFILLLQNSGFDSFTTMTQFFYKESSIFLFILKVILTCSLFYIISILITRNKEVRVS